MDDETRAFQARTEAILPTLATKADLETLRAEMQKLAVETHKWMLASVIGIFIGFGGLFVAMGNFYAKPQTVTVPAPAPQPVQQERVTDVPVVQWGMVIINPPRGQQKE